MRILTFIICVKNLGFFFLHVRAFVFLIEYFINEKVIPRKLARLLTFVMFFFFVHTYYFLHETFPGYVLIDQ